MTQDRPQHLHSLDIARGVAAFVIVFWHWHHFFILGLQPDPAFRTEMQPMFSLLRFCYLHGYEAVSLFFSLSGFIFFLLFARQIAEGELSLRAFFLHRFSRLYPLHLATLLVVAAAQQSYHTVHGSYFVFENIDLHHFVLNVLLMSSLGRGQGMSFNGPSWSVSVELFLYAVFFLSCAMLRPRPRMMIAIALCGYLVLGRYKVTLGAAVGAFFVGGFMSVLYASLTRDIARARHLVIGIIAVVTVMCATIVVLPSGPGRILPEVIMPGDAPDLLTVVIFPCFILALALAEFLRPTIFARVARWTRLGQLSYSVYLIHFPLQLLLMLAIGWLDIDARIFYSPVTMVAFFATLIALGLVSHYRFEMPLQRWLRARFDVARVT